MGRVALPDVCVQLVGRGEGHHAAVALGVVAQVVLLAKVDLGGNSGVGGQRAHLEIVSTPMFERYVSAPGESDYATASRGNRGHAWGRPARSPACRVDSSRSKLFGARTCTHIQVNWPYSHYSYEELHGSANESLGNPYDNEARGLIQATLPVHRRPTCRTYDSPRAPRPCRTLPLPPYQEHVRVLEVQVHAAQPAAHVAREVALSHVRVQLVPAVEARVAVLAARVLLVQVRGQGGGVQRGLLQREAQPGGEAHLAQGLVVGGPGYRSAWVWCEGFKSVEGNEELIGQA